MSKPKAILFGPFVGELYWECGRFAPILSHMVNHPSPKDRNIKYIVLTREDRFDLYGTYADILVPLKIPDDYDGKVQPNCFRLDRMKKGLYDEIINLFRKKYEKQYKIIRHIYPKINGNIFANKNQFSGEKMRYTFSPRKINYKLVNEYITSDKPLVVLAPRFRKGYRRNWPRWEEFYDILYKDEFLMDKFQFIICGKIGEYIKDRKDRFLDMTKIQLEEGSSLVGLLLVIMERAKLVVGSQSAIPNIGLLYKVQVLEFGNQKQLHTKTYNHFNTPITFINNAKYNIDPMEFFNYMRKILKKKEIK
jgi:hypothetical protein